MSGGADGKKRDRNIDIIRCVALFSVISVHFFLNNGFYKTVIEGNKMLLMTCVRMVFMICVPLFLLLTGYLTSEKNYFPIKGKFFLRLGDVLGQYVIITVITLLFQAFYLKMPLTFPDAVFNILRFDQYSWYVNMYIGLYLFTPFLSLVWRNLPSGREERILLAILIFISILPSIVNIYNFQTEGWWGQPSASGTYQPLLPGWWTQVYPITYYFTGAYLARRHVEKRFRAPVWLLLFCVTVVLNGVFSYYRSRGAVFVWGSWSDWCGAGNYLEAVFMFCFLKALPLERMPVFLGKIFGWIARLSFGAYIASYIIDQLVYPILIERIPAVEDRLSGYFPTVLTVFAGALAISFVVDLFMRGVGGLVKRLRRT